MTREIKFRAWSKKHKEMDEGGFGVEQFWGDALLLDSPIKDFEPEDFIFMQYTGLKDKHGKEIYEGDIVTTSINESENDYKGEVAFDRGTFCLRSLTLNWNQDREILTMWKDGLHRWSSIEHCTEMSILGNIHQNPELLKEQECQK